MADVCQYLQPLQRLEPAFMSFWLLVERNLRQQEVVSVTSFFLRRSKCQLNRQHPQQIAFIISQSKTVVYLLSLIISYIPVFES